VRSGAEDNQGVAAQFKRVWTRYFLFFFRLNGLSDLIFDYFVYEFKYRLEKLRIRWLVLYVFSFPPYYVYMS